MGSAVSPCALRKGAEPMSAQGTAAAKKSATKGQRLAGEMLHQLGGVAVPAGTDGRRIVSQMEAERNGKLAAAREAQRALDQEADKDAQPVVEKRKKAKRIPAALNIVPTPKAKKATKKPTLTVVPAAPASTVPAGEKFCKRHNT